MMVCLIQLHSQYRSSVEAADVRFLGGVLKLFLTVCSINNFSRDKIRPGSQPPGR